MSIDLVHDDVERSLIKVTLEQQRAQGACLHPPDACLPLVIGGDSNQEVEVIRSCQERMRRVLDRAAAQLA